MIEEFFLIKSANKTIKINRQEKKIKNKFFFICKSFLSIFGTYEFEWVQNIYRNILFYLAISFFLPTTYGEEKVVFVTNTTNLINVTILKATFTYFTLVM